MCFPMVLGDPCDRVVLPPKGVPTNRLRSAGLKLAIGRRKDCLSTPLTLRAELADTQIETKGFYPIQPFSIKVWQCSSVFNRRDDQYPRFLTKSITLSPTIFALIIVHELLLWGTFIKVRLNPNTKNT
ncbi:hypothetical protein XENTR_v10012926 [Xenopus tropicalis]|nr:hypothetical protein XENTR_v10012926 [Xenopus tropicalis]